MPASSPYFPCACKRSCYSHFQDQGLFRLFLSLWKWNRSVWTLFHHTTAYLFKVSRDFLQSDMRHQPGMPLSWHLSHVMKLRADSAVLFIGPAQTQGRWLYWVCTPGDRNLGDVRIWPAIKKVSLFHSFVNLFNDWWNIRFLQSH